MEKLDTPENPDASSNVSHSQEVQLPILPASRRARFINLSIDYAAQTMISFVFAVVVLVIGGEQGSTFLDEIPGFLIGVIILLTYYFVLESITSRTLGKLVTGTKVVNENGQPPTTTQIACRTFCRLIPFEAISFFNAQPRGLHDSIPKTFVVKTRQLWHPGGEGENASSWQ